MTAVVLLMMKTPVLRMYQQSQGDTDEEVEMQHNDHDVIIDHEKLPYQEFGLINENKAARLMVRLSVSESNFSMVCKLPFSRFY